jgi:hypothetical protein
MEMAAVECRLIGPSLLSKAEEYLSLENAGDFDGPGAWLEEQSFLFLSDCTEDAIADCVASQLKQKKDGRRGYSR